MVDDKILAVHAAKAVALMLCDILIAETEAEIAHDDIVALDGHRPSRDADAVTRCSLPGVVVFEFTLSGLFR